MLKARFYSLQNERLQSIEQQSTAILKKIETGLIPLITNTDMDNKSINETSSASIYINHLFILNPKGKVIYPLRSSEAITPRELDFLNRNSDILLNPQTYQPSKADAHNGWYSWYIRKKLHLILWSKTIDSYTVGVELHQERIINEIINSIPKNISSNDYQLTLKNAEQNLYQYSSETQSFDASVKTELPYPLHSYQFVYQFNEPNFISPLRKYFLMGFSLIIAGALSGICYLFYREQIRNIRESAQRVNFANQVSHELKTPLTNIRMYAELLEFQLSDDDPKVTKRLNVIIKESHRLSRMINNVLNFAKQENDSVFIKTEEIVLDPLLQEVLNKFDLAFRKKEISIKLHLNSQKTIEADPDLITQIIGNLLSNVEKYVPQKSNLDISTYQDNELTTLIMQDNGPGIAKKHKEKIFQSFYRISNQLSDGVTGTGIGLAIARDFARAHRGDLELVPSESGACFKLTLPNARK
ncbi:HAMP domain-containing sensor histidine kinase [Lentisphaera profundi]|uniref:histidine kinase n=1 Tax=Lentisphaera profundi TaxID=1658616 RepID=A0ABY7VXM9_9BACT|nr:HAMP domain-containing sensor histidine kinase [Lentisphaera profundi]WDE97617.1 HAMP domain-containing sensor histidine kinase [Lentisphaera profundi]